MTNVDKAGHFYLGKTYDMAGKQILDEPVQYDARDLTTHAICVGMTGSGKTGLCTLILEEAALNGVPSIIIDPKGDITNLCLTFPDLRPGDFEPWINPDDARRKGLSISEYAERTAAMWADGLEQWGEGPERIRRLKASAEFSIYTPGSDAGIPISILDTMRAPQVSWSQEEDALRERISSTVSALLGLVGADADPLKSREHILLSNIFEQVWRQGEDLDVAKLIQLVHKPPMRKLGVFDVDTFFPEQDRFELAIKFNNILAAPSFENWIEGQPLDIENVLRAPDGRPRASIFYIAHLDDAQRMFFVTLLLEQITTWVRAQSGTTSLRALVYLDETYGYFPPYPANPPSKAPLMTLLKQARAFGLGVILTTQNPVDLDYKGLTNAGTWFIGKLQTDRDKARVLEGLEGAISEAGSAMDRRSLDRAISGLDSRVFLLHNVHEDAPQIFMTRWAMSYLRGPLTRRQIQELMAGQEVPAEPAVQASQAARTLEAVESDAPAPPEGLLTTTPQIDPDIPQFFLVTDTSAQRALRQEQERRPTFSMTPERTDLVYDPKVFAWASVAYQDAAHDIDHSEQYMYLANPSANPALVRWEDAELSMDNRDLEDAPEKGAYFADLPAGLGQKGDIKALNTALADYLYGEKRLRLWRNLKLKLYSQVKETEEAFEKRCRQALERMRDEQADKIKASYETKIDRLQDRLRREERELAQDEAEHEARKREEMLHVGESILNVILSRKAGRALSSASTKRRLTAQAAADIKESEQTIADLGKEIEDLKQKMLDEMADLDIRMAEILDEREEYLVKPRRADVRIDLFGIGWVPRWRVSGTDSRGRETEALLSAYRDL